MFIPRANLAYVSRNLLKDPYSCSTYVIGIKCTLGLKYLLGKDSLLNIAGYSKTEKLIFIGLTPAESFMTSMRRSQFYGSSMKQAGLVLQKILRS